jgi:hypothetical protein
LGQCTRGTSNSKYRHRRSIRRGLVTTPSSIEAAAVYDWRPFQRFQVVRRLCAMHTALGPDHWRTVVGDFIR